MIKPSQMRWIIAKTKPTFLERVKKFCVTDTDQFSTKKIITVDEKLIKNLSHETIYFYLILIYYGKKGLVVDTLSKYGSIVGNILNVVGNNLDSWK